MVKGRGPWRVGDDTSLLLLDLAAGRAAPVSRFPSGYFMELAVRHGLVGLMASGSDSLLTKAALPVFARLQARQQIMERHLHRLLTSMRAAGIPATVVKGPHLARSVYANSAERTYTDLDVLVPPQYLDATLDVLQADPAVSSIPPKTPKADKRHIPMVDESGVMFTVDLHWDLFSYSQLRGCADGAVDWAWSEARFEPDHPLGPLWELPEEAMLAFLATHAILDHRFRLILFRDLVEAARRGVDWGRLEAFARRWQLRSTSYLSLLIASRALGAPIDEATLDRFRPDYAQLGWVERLLSTTDLVRFDGHRAHPLNLAVVTSHDRLVDRVWLTMTAPGSFPRWRERVRRQFGAPLATQHRSVVHVLPRDLARGAQTYARALSDGLNPSLNSVTVAMYESEPAGLGPDIGLGLEMGRLRRAGFDPRVMLRLRRLLRSMNPDVVIAHGGEPLKYCAPAVPQSSALVYYKIGSSRALLQNPVRRTLHKLLMGRADLVAAVSPEMVDEAENFFGVPAEKCVYIPNGRDPEVFAPGDNSSGAPVVFVFVGHLARTKRPDVFLRVMAALRDRGLDVKGIVVGDGPMMERVKSMATAEIELLGTRDDVPSILARSDVFVFPSVTEGEGMPGVVIEAGLAGLPVVATRVPGISTVVADGETGFLVDVEDFAGMVDAAERLALDPDLRHALGHAARYRCEREFGLESSIGKWKDVLHALIDRQRSRVAT